VPDGAVTAETLTVVADRFHAEHRATYGYDFSADASQQVEWVNLRVSGIGPIQRPEIRRSVEQGGGQWEVRSADTRGVCFDAAAGYVETPIVPRARLRPGVRVEGPAIIEEFGSTVPIHPGFSATVDAWRNLIVTRDHDDEGGGA
jgi:N-methylhydantoinase A